MAGTGYHCSWSVPLPTSNSLGTFPFITFPLRTFPLPTFPLSTFPTLLVYFPPFKYISHPLSTFPPSQCIFPAPFHVKRFSASSIPALGGNSLFKNLYGLESDLWFVYLCFRLSFTLAMQCFLSFAIFLFCKN